MAASGTAISPRDRVTIKTMVLSLTAFTSFLTPTFDDPAFALMRCERNMAKPRVLEILNYVNEMLGYLIYDI